MTLSIINKRTRLLHDINNKLKTGIKTFFGRPVKRIPFSKHIPFKEKTFHLGNNKTNLAFQKKLKTAIPNNLPTEMTHLIYLERFANGISTRKNNPLATFTHVEPEYRPDSPAPSFPIPLVQLPKTECQIYTSEDCHPEISAFFVKNNSVFLAMHPQVFKDHTVEYQQEIVKHSSKELSVSPSSSSRTVFCVR